MSDIAAVGHAPLTWLVAAEVCTDTQAPRGPCPHWSLSPQLISSRMRFALCCDPRPPEVSKRHGQETVDAVVARLERQLLSLALNALSEV